MNEEPRSDDTAMWSLVGAMLNSVCRGDQDPGHAYIEIHREVHGTLTALRRQLAKVEAERDEVRQRHGEAERRVDWLLVQAQRHLARREDAEARVAAVEKLAAKWLPSTRPRIASNFAAELRAALAAAPTDTEPPLDSDTLPVPYFVCPACGATTRARMADAEPTDTEPGRCGHCHRPLPHSPAELRACPATEPKDQQR